MLDLDQSIMERHSTRMFLPRPVPQELVEEALALAQHAPSNSNIQPWRLVFVTGTARNRLKDALFKVADHEAPHIPALPKAFEHYRYEFRAEVYGSMGMPIADTARHAAAVTRNFFFRRTARRHRQHASRPWPGRRSERLHVPADADIGSDGTRAGHVHGGLGGGLSVHSSQRAQDCAPNLRSYPPWPSAIPNPTSRPTNCASGATRSRSTSCTSTARAGEQGGQRGYRTTSCSVPRGCELMEDRANA
jgi:hypothetical protein